MAPSPGRVPTLLTATEIAGLLRTSKKAVYAMIERQQLPGVVRIGRRVLIREEALPETGWARSPRHRWKVGSDERDS